MSETNPVMTKEEMKKALRLKRPLKCAYGLAKQGMALMLDPHKMGRALLLEMAPLKLQGPAFGTAERDAEDDTKLRLTVNKVVPGAAKRLVRTLRGTGVKHIWITSDEGETDSAADEEPEEHAAEEHTGQSSSNGANRPLPPLPGGAVGAKAPVPTSGAPSPTVQAVPQGGHDLNLRMQQAIGRVKAAGLTDPAILHALKAAVTFNGAGDAAAAEKLLAAVEAKLDGGTASGPTGSAPPKSPDQVRYEQALLLAQGDLAKARSAKLPQVKQDQDGLAALVARLPALTTSGDYKGAAALLAQARTLAAKVIGTAAQVGQQQETFDRMAGPLQKVQSSYFTKGAGDAMRREKLSPGKEFKAFSAAQMVFESARDQASLGKVEQTAQVYLQHYAHDLSDRQKNHKESLRKKQICESALKQASHMRMALEMEDIGPPPWDEDKALSAAAIRAQFSFESMGTPAKPLAGSEGGVSAAFWVKGFAPDAKKANGSPNPDAEKSDFLFKPARGEDDTGDFKAGDSAPREAVTKSLTDKIGLMTGIDLGVPPTSIVTLPPGTVDFASYNAPQYDPGTEEMMPQERPIDGTQPQVGSLQQFRSSKGSVKEQPDGFKASVPPSQCEKAAVLDILSLNTDRHEGNFMVGEQKTLTGGMEPTLIPIDHGLTLPGREAMRKRGADRMNDPGGNVLLSMPGSHEGFSAEMQERIGMIDPDGIAQAIRDSRAAVQKAHPDLDAAGRIGDDSILLAKRSAMFLKRACRQLSPALVQIALANRQADIFDSSDQDFASAADRVIAAYANQKDALKAFCLGDDAYGKFLTDLKKLGYHQFGAFPAEMAKFKAWFAENATVLTAACKNKTQWAGQPPKPV